MVQPETRHKVLVWLYHEGRGDGPRVLVLKRAPPRKREWHPVTGHVEQGEALEEAAVREATEETGCRPEATLDLEYDYGFTDERNGEKHAYEEHAFALRVETESCTLSHEHEDYQWVPLADAGPLIQFPEQREALKRLADRLSIPVPWDDD